MLILVFYLGEDRYGLAAQEVLLIIPALELRPLPQAPDFIVGIFQYKDHVVPVVDLQQLTHQKKCRNCLSTRIILTHYHAPKTQEKHLLGLMAEGVTETLEIGPKDFQQNEVSVAQAPYLEKMGVDSEGMIQMLHLQHILPKALQETLFIR